jgi:hypothetical protein
VLEAAMSTCNVSFLVNNFLVKDLLRTKETFRKKKLTNWQRRGAKTEKSSGKSPQWKTPLGVREEGEMSSFNW